MRKGRQNHLRTVIDASQPGTETRLKKPPAENGRGFPCFKACIKCLLQGCAVFAQSSSTPEAASQASAPESSQEGLQSDSSPQS